MRRVVLCLALAFAAACGKKAATGEPATGSGSSSVADEEQARFDAERRPEKLVEALGIGPGSKVADIGAGSGLLTVHLARAVAPNGKVVATDVDGAVLDLLAQRLRSQKLEGVVERRVVGAETSGLAPGEFDAILLAEVDHYFTDPAAWLEGAAAALKPGGRIVISNRIYHKAQSIDAAKKAGLEEHSITSPMPSHFIAVFVVPKGKSK
jgi:ubiquinone/menaquinone biosynthesis C-methylase UbiE